MRGGNLLDIVLFCITIYAMKKKSSQKKPRWQGLEPEEDRGNRPATERKDRVLQARVSPSLYNSLVAQARRLRVPVSNLVRNILEDSTRMVENIVDSGIEIAEAIGKGMDHEDLSSVLGWQPMMANKQLACSHCGHPIEKGSEAFMSVGAPSSRTFVICEDCKCKI
jgi:hypothetical protein